MWKAVNSVYKSANKNIKKLSKNIPSMSTVSENIQKIKIPKLIPKTTARQLSDLQKALNSIFSNKKPVMPINKMSMIAELTYESQNFDQAFEMILSKVRVFKYESKFAKQTLNSLILISYLIKNGPSGFVDEFRQEMNIFEEHSELSLQNAYISSQKQIQKLKPLLIDIRQRAKYIVGLLTDKKKLLRQKQIAMEIKRKIIEGMNKENSSFQNIEANSLINHFKNASDSQNNKKSVSQNVDSFLQHYVWKYWNKFDQKMQNITEKILQKIQQYLDLQEPESFSIEDLQVDQKKQDTSVKTETDLSISVKKQQQKFMKEKDDLDIKVEEEDKGPVLSTDLV